MNITFFIGNGYDMNIGLNTGYRDFLSWYILQETDDETISLFRELISSDIDTWSDLEKTLGKMTVTPPLDQREAFLKCKRDLDSHLKKYMQTQNDRIRVPSRRDQEMFEDSLVYFRDLCNPEVQRKISEVYQVYDYLPYVYNVIDFNFTNTVDMFWKNTPQLLSWHSWRPKNCKKPVREVDKKGALVHIHGTLSDSMMTGVDNAGQLSNTYYRSDEDMIDCCVKPAMNFNCNNGTNRMVDEIIKQTHLFVIFGMSIGETDKRWWKKVVEQLLWTSSYLLIINYDPNHDPALPYTTSRIAKSIISNLIRVGECRKEYEERLKAKITVLLNTKLFQYKSVLKEDETILG